MKRIPLVIISLMFIGSLGHAELLPYSESYPKVSFEAITGVLGREGSISPVYGFGFERRGFPGDLKLSYVRAMDAGADSLESKDLDLHTLSLEYFIPVMGSNGKELRLGGGLGYTIPNLAGGVFETADNGISYTAGALISYPFRSVTLEAGVRAFFFRTDSHLTKFGSHLETFQVNGVDVGQVEVADETHYNNTINVNSVLATIAVRF